jgi:hypothetical protein
MADVRGSTPNERCNGWRGVKMKQDETISTNKNRREILAERKSRKYRQKE